MAIEDTADLEGFFDIEDGFAVSAVYRAQGEGAGKSVPVILNSPDVINGVAGLDFVTGTTVAQVMVKDASGLSEGDTLTIGGIVYRVAGAPDRNADRSIWTAGLVEAE